MTRGLKTFFLLFLLVPPVLADNLSPFIQSFHEGRERGRPLAETLAVELDRSLEDAIDILTAAIAVAPARVAEIVRVSVALGVEAEPVAAQCETALTEKQRLELVKTALGERIDARPVLERCLVLLEPSEWPGIIADAVNNSTPGQIQGVIESAYRSLAPVTDQAFFQVREGLLRSSAFAVSGLELSDDIDGLLDEIRLQDQLEVLQFDETAEVDNIADVDEFVPPEGPPLSDQ